MALMLTRNAIFALSNGAIELRPVLQIVGMRQIRNAHTSTERFRLVLSDGLHLQQAMLSTQLNEKVHNKLAVMGSIVQLLEYICNTAQNRKKQEAALEDFGQPPPASPSAPSPVRQAANRGCGPRAAGGLKLESGATANGAGLEHGQQPNNTKRVCPPGL